MLAELSQRPFPGNVRELRNAVLAFVALGQIMMPDGDQGPRSSQEGAIDRALAEAVRLDVPFLAQRESIADRFTSLYVDRLLQETQGNQTAAAKLASLDRT